MNLRLFFLLLFVLPISAFADTGYYLDHRPDTVYPTGQAACDTTLSEAQALASPGFLITEVYAGQGYCAYTVVRQSDNYAFHGQGSACSTPGVPCYMKSVTCQSGYQKTFTWPLGRKDSNAEYNIAPGTEIAPPSLGCTDKCEVARTTGNAGCFNFDGEGAITYCDYNGLTTGKVCSVSDYPEPEVPEIPPPDPCEANPQGPGCPGGGDPGGGDPCETNPNAEGCSGGGDPGGGDPCETNPNAEGCSGGGDPGGGDPGGGDPGGGDPGGGDPGGGDDGGSAGGLGCDQPLVCEGDAIACAQLILQKEQKCGSEAAGDFPGQKDEIADFLDNPDYKAEEDEEINLGEMFSEGTRFLPSSCPEAKTFSLTTNGGRSFSLSFQPLCQFASDLSYLIVAAAAVFYALYVGRAVGGE